MRLGKTSSEANIKKSKIQEPSAFGRNFDIFFYLKSFVFQTLVVRLGKTSSKALMVRKFVRQSIRLESI